MRTLIKYGEQLLMIGLVTAVVVAVCIVSGCKANKPTPAEKAAAVRIETQQAATAITQLATAADTRIADARTEIAGVIAAPTSRPVERLTKADASLADAQANLHAVLPKAEVIVGKAAEAETLTVVEAKRADDTQGKLDKERSSFWSFKQRAIFWWTLGIITAATVALAILAFVVRLAGAQDLLKAIWGVLADVLGYVWAAIKWLFHLATFGLVKAANSVADRINDKYEPKKPE